MRAKHLTLLVAIFAIITMMFVSCNSEVAENSAISEPGKELVYASFVDKGAKELSFSYDVPAYDTLFWRYSAVKKDSYGTVGQTWAGGTAEEVFAPIPTDATTPTQGLAGKVGPFSQGKWDFKLQAFRSCTLDNNTLVFSDKVFEGTTENVVLNKNQTNYIAVTVTPAGDTGKIKISDAYYKWFNDNNVGSEDVKLVVTLVGRPDGSNSTEPVTYTYNEVLTKEESENKYKFIGINGYIAIPDSETTVTTAIPAGVYTATFKIVEDTDTPTIDEFVLQTFSLKVYGGLETIVTGNLTEGLSYENYFSVPEQEIAFTTSNSAGAASFVVDKTPSTATGESIKTTVVFPDNSLSTNTQHTLSVDVTTIETAETQFVIVTEPEQNPEVAVAAIGLELTKTTVTTNESGAVTDTETSSVSEFTDYVTITTYIQDGLTGKVTVVYNDPNAGTQYAKTQPIAKEGATEETEGKSVASMYATDDEMDDKLGYSAESGKLRFKTNHFSDFYVKTDGLCAKNIQTGRYYSTLQTAVDAALEGQTVQVIKDVVDLGTTGLTISGKDVTLDLNGKTITGTVNGKLVAIVKGASATIIDSSNSSTGRIYNTDISAQGHDAVANYGTLTIEGGEFGNPDKQRGAGFRNYGTATINGGVFHGKPNSGNEGWAYAIINDVTTGYTKPKMTINKATVNGKMNGGIAINGGTVVINEEVSVSVDNPDSDYTGYYAIYLCNEDAQITLTVNGGTFVAQKSSIYVDMVSSRSTKVVINGGDFSGGTNDNPVTVGGARASDVTRYSAYYYVSAYGGYYYKSLDERFVAPGYECVFDSISEKYTVRKYDTGIASIERNDEIIYFKTLDEACSAAKSGETVNLLSDLTFTNEDFIATSVSYGESCNTIIKRINSGVVFNGNNHKITFNKVEDGCLVSVLNGSIKDLDMYFDDCVDCKTAMDSYHACEFRNVDVYGSITWTSGNQAAYIIYPDENVTFTDCTNYATLQGTGEATCYNAIFVGYTLTNGDYTFNNCVNAGSIVSGRAAMFVANGWYGATTRLVLDGVYNNGRVRTVANISEALYSDANRTVNYFLAIPQDKPNIISVVIGDEEYSSTSMTKWWEINEMIPGTGSLEGHVVDATLAIAKNSDKTFTITPATSEGVHHYIVSVGLYVNTNNGSDRYYVTETIEHQNSNITTTIKDLLFVDSVWVTEHTSAEKGDPLCGNKTYILDNVTYFLVDKEGRSTNGAHQPATSDMISVSAYNSNNKLICSVQFVDPL